MQVIDMDYIKELMKDCRGGNLLITYYRDCDIEKENIKELFEYIDKNKSKDYNWVKLKIDDDTEKFANLCVYPPCTVLYCKGDIRYNFGSYRTGKEIVDMTTTFGEYFITHRNNNCYYYVPERNFSYE